MSTLQVRRHLFAREIGYAIDRDGIRFRIVGQPEQAIPLSEIRSVHLKSLGKFDSANETQFTCVIRTTTGKIVLTNRHFVGLARFEYRSAQYRQVVESLYRCLQGCDDQVQFLHGSTAMVWMIFGLCLLVAGAFGVLAVAVLTEGLAASTRTLALLAIFVTTLPTLCVGLWQVFRAGWTRPHTSETLPTAFLPGA